MLFVMLERPKGIGSYLQGELSPTSEEVEVGFSFREHGSRTQANFSSCFGFLAKFYVG